MFFATACEHENVQIEQEAVKAEDEAHLLWLIS